MYNFNKKTYGQLSEQLLESITSDSFIYSTINLLDDQIHIQFSSTLFPQLKIVDYPEGSTLVVEDIIHVWWSVRTYDGNEEMLNDFDFNLLKESLCHR